jgi:hypothetical protein
MDGACVLGVGALCTVYRMCWVENLGVGVPGLPGTLAREFTVHTVTRTIDYFHPRACRSARTEAPLFGLGPFVDRRARGLTSRGWPEKFFI